MENIKTILKAKYFKVLNEKTCEEERREGGEKPSVICSRGNIDRSPPQILLISDSGEANAHVEC